MKNAIRKMLLSYVAIAAICVGAGNANGDLFQFSFDDHNGNSGYGILEASPSTRGDGSYLATSGNLTLTSTISSLDGTYNLIPVGETSPFGLPNDGVFIADDIFFPSNNAGNGIATGVYNSSFLTQWGGLIFGSNPGT